MWSTWSCSVAPQWTQAWPHLCRMFHRRPGLICRPCVQRGRSRSSSKSSRQAVEWVSGTRLGSSHSPEGPSTTARSTSSRLNIAGLLPVVGYCLATEVATTPLVVVSRDRSMTDGFSRPLSADVGLWIGLDPESVRKSALLFVIKRDPSPTRPASSTVAWTARRFFHERPKVILGHPTITQG